MYYYYYYCYYEVALKDPSAHKVSIVHELLCIDVTPATTCNPPLGEVHNPLWPLNWMSSGKYVVFITLLARPTRTPPKAQRQFHQIYNQTYLRDLYNANMLSRKLSEDTFVSGTLIEHFTAQDSPSFK